MSDVGDDYRALREESQQRRANNRVKSAEYLTAHGISFESKNHGAHLVVSYGSVTLDFWPGTGKWISRCGKKGFGVHKLVEFLK